MWTRSSVILIALALLTGCGSGVSAEDEAKLIEYKSCLDAELARFIALGGEWAVKANDYAQSGCAKYKP